MASWASSGSILAEFGGVAPSYHIDYFLSQFRLEEFLKAMSPEQVAEGVMDFFVNLAIQRKTTGEPKLAADGVVSLRGKGLKLHRIDLDQKIFRFESSQNFNLVAVIDAKGCDMVRQKIHGTFQKPLVEKPGVIKSLTAAKSVRRRCLSSSSVLSACQNDIFICQAGSLNDV